MRFPRDPPSEGKFAEFLSSGPTLPDGRYLHWDELRHREPPAKQTRQEWWLGMRLARRLATTAVGPMREAFAEPFGFVETPAIREALHEIDRRNVSGVLAAELGNEEAATEYRVRGLIEEAISSSIIEGARPTTRELARQMVREQRAPASKDERMILNNWRAMQRIVELRVEGREVEVEDLLELHRIIGEGALDVDGGAGTLRTSGQVVRVEDDEGNVWHTPPPVDDPKGRFPPLDERVRVLLRFANGDPRDGGTFIHPVVRAIVSHFWLAYEHPFRDGNGRVARALFYWVMLRHGYDMTEFLSISGPIDKKRSAYYRAFAFVETDHGDLTYFILHQLGVLRSALDELLDHVKERVERRKELARIVRRFDDLNHRQRALLEHAVRHPLESQTIDGHAASHRVHYQTARADLLGLVDLGYFEAARVGKGKRFRPTRKLAKLVNR